MMIEKLRFLLMNNKTLKSIFQPVYALAMKPMLLKQNYIFKKYGLEALEKLNNVFESEGVLYWLEFGTLLGAVREKNFIKHDLDIDIGLFIENDNKKIEKILFNAGFKKVQQIEIDRGIYGVEQSYHYKGVTIDLFYFTKKDELMFCHVFASEYGKSWESTIHENGGLVVYEHKFPYEGFKKINFLNMYLTIPSNYEEHLSAQYGDNFMIKNKNWNPYKMASNKEVLVDKRGVVV